MKSSLFAWLMLGSVLSLGAVQAATPEQGAPFVGGESVGAAAESEFRSSAHSANKNGDSQPQLSAVLNESSATPQVICAPLWDWRYGEAVLGRWGVKYTAATQVTINGNKVALADLDKADYLRQVRGSSACARLNQQGNLERVDLVVAKRGERAGSIREVSVEPRVVRAGATVEFTLRTELGRANTVQQASAGQQNCSGDTVASSRRDVPRRQNCSGNAVASSQRDIPRWQASFFVAGVGQEIAAQEVAPGVYRARWIAPKLDTRGLRVLGRLEEPGQSAVLNQRAEPDQHAEPDQRADLGQQVVCWGDSFDVVLNPPEIKQWGASVVDGCEVIIFAQYESAGTSIEPGQVRIWVDGREATKRFQRTDRLTVGVLSSEEVRPGTLCCVKVTDRSGQSMKRYWRVGSEE